MAIDSRPAPDSPRWVAALFIGPPLALFAAHLAHNVAFIPVVNRARSRAVYVGMDSAALALATATTVAFRRVSPPAARTMLPYLGWLCVTTWLKVRWWRLTRA